MKKTLNCPECGTPVEKYRNPIPTVDIIISMDSGIIMIKRRNPPYGWALPGGFIDYGESAEDAAVREAKEETSLDINDLKMFNAYSAPDRDPREHTITICFTARADGKPVASDDAEDIAVFTKETLPSPLAFDHGKILMDYFTYIERKRSILTDLESYL